MVRLVLGPAGSGKSQLVMSELARRTADGREGAFLLVPEQYSHEKERALCAAAGDSACRCVEVLSFKSLARRVLWLAGGGARPRLSEGGRLLCLRAAVSSVAPRLTVYASAATRADFLPRLASAVDEFIRYRVTPQALSNASRQLKEGTTAQKLADLAHIYTAYTALTSVGAADPLTEADAAARLLADSGLLCEKEVYIDGFGGFTPQEWALVEGAARQAACVTLCLCAPNGEPPFEGPDACARRMQRFCASHGIGLEYVRLSGDHRHATPALAAVESEFFARVPRPYTGPAEEVTLLSAASRRSECMAVAAEIRRLCTAGGYRYREVAVTCRAFADYDLLLENVFADYGIPYFSDRTRSMTEQPLWRLLSTALDAVLTSFETERVLENLRCGFAPISDEELDELEGYVRTWRMPGHRWTDKSPWTASPRGLCVEASEEDARRAARIDGLRHRAVAPLAALSRAMKRGGTARELCEAVFTYTEQLQLSDKLLSRESRLRAEGRVRDAEEIAQQYDAFVDALDQIVAAGESTPYTAREFADALRLVLGAARLGSIPDSLDSVAAGEAGRMRISAPRAVFILGANEDILPAAPRGDGLISDAERELLADVGAGIELAPAGYDAAAAENLILYNALAAPSERLYVCCPERDGKGGSLRPSYVMERLRQLLPGACLRRAEDGESRTWSPSGLAELSATNGKYAAAARELLLQEREGARRLALRKHFLSPDAPVADEELNRSLYGERLHVSPSRMETYAACRFRYFAESGLHAREPVVAELSPNVSGTFVHYVLEQVARRVGSSGGWRACTPEQLQVFTREYADRFLNSPEGIPAEARTPRMRYYLRRLIADTCEIVLRMHEEFLVSEFQPHSFEVDLSSQGEICYRLGGVDVVITGRVDRVDAWNDGSRRYIRVIDYKTGSKEMNFTDVRAGLSVQMLVYLFALADQSGDLPAGILYTKASLHNVNAKPGDDVRTIEKQRNREQRPTGLVLDDAAVISAMEKGVEQGEEVRFLPVGKKKSDTLLKTGEFLSLRRHVEGLLASMAGQLRAGTVTPDPYAKKETNACAYCPYAAVCRFDEERSGYSYRYLEQTDKEQFFARINGEERP